MDRDNCYSSTESVCVFILDLDYDDFMITETLLQCWAGCDMHSLVKESSSFRWVSAIF